MYNDLFNQNTNLVYKIVNRMYYGHGDRDDLIQVGLMGLYQATLNFDITRNVSFSTYASYYIMGEIRKEIRSNRAIKLSKEIFKILRKIKGTNENQSLDALCTSLEVSKDNLLLALIYQDNIVSLNKEYEEQELLNVVPDQNEGFSYDLMYGLDKVSQEVILLKYYKGYTQNQIGKIMRLSQSKISRVEKKALSIIRNSR